MDVQGPMDCRPLLSVRGFWDGRVIPYNRVLIALPLSEEG